MTRVWFFIALLVITPATVYGQPLWQLLTPGMSIDEVQSAYPEAVAGEGRKLLDGAQMRLKLPRLELHDELATLRRLFEVWFFFKDDELTQIWLYEPAGVGTEADYHALLVPLRGKYGPEFHGFILRKANGIEFDSGQAIWLQGDTSIRLVVSSLPYRDVVIIYSTTVADNAKKL